MEGQAGVATGKQEHGQPEPANPWWEHLSASQMFIRVRSGRTHPGCTPEVRQNEVLEACYQHGGQYLSVASETGGRDEVTGFSTRLLTRYTRYILVPDGLHSSKRPPLSLAFAGLMYGGLKRGHGLNFCCKEELLDKSMNSNSLWPLL